MLHNSVGIVLHWFLSDLFVTKHKAGNLGGKNAHQFSILLAQAGQFFLRSAQSIQRLHENSDFFTCIETGDSVRQDTSGSMKTTEIDAGQV